MTNPIHPPRNPLLVILILGALSTITPLSIDMYLPAFPQIAAQLHVSVAQVSLSLSSFFIGTSIGQIFYGPLLDRLGRKPPLYFGLALYALSCVGCLFSHSLTTLIAFRFLQALGGCVAQVASMAMVRDFFHAREGARIFSLLMLILGVSPLFAPTIGGLVATSMGWPWIFIALGGIVIAILAAIFFFLPDAHPGDPSISLAPLPILKNFAAIFREPQFHTYALSGAFALGAIFAYVAGSPILFMNIYHVTAQTYGIIFAGLAVGFIGASQVNIVLSRRFGSNRVFRTAILCQAFAGLIFLAGALGHWYGFTATLITLFIFLSCTGLTYPHAAAIALAPFHSKQAGSASALLGFLQLGVGALTSAAIGSFDSTKSLPVIAVMAGTAWLGLIALFLGRRNIVNEVEVGNHTADPEPMLAH
jgi:DHA1 family bicyclomycin/chloramphenicol resistance-like MFS transporter